MSNKFQEDVSELIQVRKKLGWKPTDATEQEIKQDIDTSVIEKISDDEDFYDHEYHKHVRAEATRQLLAKRRPSNGKQA